MVWLVYRHGRDTRRSYRQDQDPSVRRSREQHVLCAWTPGHRTGRRLRWHGLQHEQASPASRAGGWPGQVLYNVCNLWLGRFPKPDFMFSMVISNCYFFWVWNEYSRLLKKCYNSTRLKRINPSWLEGHACMAAVRVVWQVGIYMKHRADVSSGLAGMAKFLLTVCTPCARD